MVRGENFCQQCGNRISVALQDTVIGACYHCGTSWRSGWLFCKNCGLDRKRALLLSTSAPVAASPAPGVKLNGQEQHEELPEATKINCHFCGAEAKPYSRFCESCGKRIDGGGNVEKSAPEIVVITPPASPQVIPLTTADSRLSAPTLFELPPRPESKLPAQVSAHISESGLPGATKSATVTPANNVQPSVTPGVVTESGKPTAAADTPSPKFSEPVLRTKPEERHQSYSQTHSPTAHSSTVVTPLPPYTRMPDDVPTTDAFLNTRARNRQMALQVLLMAGVIALIGFGLVWVLWGNRFGKEETLTQPTPEILKALPTQQPSPVAQTSQPAEQPAEEMIYIPGGTFEMGRADGDEYESPARSVTVNPFFIDRTEVTNEAYRQFVTATGHRAPPHWPDGKFPDSAAKLPVVNVSWDDANAYAKWANKRLPTEAEWEFAARGTDGRIYPWGNTWNPSATNAARTVGGKIVEVGSFPGGASPFGVLDMCGNVWEWTAGSLKSYAQGGQEVAPGKVIRGGAFDVPSTRATVTYRGVLLQDRLPDKTGFRTVRDAAKP